MSESMTYKGVGVDYDAMDPFKRSAQVAGLSTSGNLARHRFAELEASRGESAYVIEGDDCLLAHVEEGLGTKNLVADRMEQLTGRSYYNQIAQCTVAMIVNDMITVGAFPLSVEMHLAVGNSHWFDNQKRTDALIAGWQHACNLARCAWGGGETPTLPDIILPDAAVLAGSAMGIVKPRYQLIVDNIQHGDAIIIMESSGIHANGLTMARRIADRKDGFWQKILHRFFDPGGWNWPLKALSNGYLTQLPDGKTYGETLLTPTHIYVPLIEDLIEAGVKINYAVNITGHGWRKLMRSPRNFAYIITGMPTQLPIFDFIQKHGPVDDYEAYGNLNMGAGFAIYVPSDQVQKALTVAETYKFIFRTYFAGHIEASDNKKVIIPLKNLTYSAETLGVR